MNNTNEPICVRHWFEPKATLGAPGTMWQECELCGKTLDQILANYISRKEVIDVIGAQEKLNLATHGRADCKSCALIETLNEKLGLE